MFEDGNGKSGMRLNKESPLQKCCRVPEPTAARFRRAELQKMSGVGGGSHRRLLDRTAINNRHNV